MQVSLENLGKLSRKLTVRIPAERVESKVRERFAELARTVRLKGFRPGKVPSKVIEQRFGAQVRQEAMSEIVGSTFEEAVTRENLRPAMQPRISAGPQDAGEIEYTATFEVMPELGTVDVSGLNVVKTTSQVEDADVERMIETLRQQRRQWTPVERVAQAGDMVLFEYDASADQLRYPNIGRERAGTIVGSGALFEGFEQRLVGLKVDDETSFEIDFPADFRVPELSDKHAKVELKVVRVQESSLPEIDDAFIGSFGVREGGLEQFRRDVRANLERELNQALNFRTKTDVLDKLVAANRHIELPEGMVEQQARAMHAHARQQAEQAGAAVEQVGEHTDYLTQAHDRVLASLLLNEIGRQNQIKLDPRRVTDLLATIAQTYEEPSQVIELYSRDQELMNGLRGRVAEDQAVEWILQHATVSESAMSFSDVMQRPGA